MPAAGQDSGRQPPGGLLGEIAYLQALWGYAAAVGWPSELLAGASLVPTSVATRAAPPQPGLGPRFSAADTVLCFDAELADQPDETEHDRLAPLYTVLVPLFSGPIFRAALRQIDPLLRPDARVLDLACGTGTEQRQVASRVPEGEVVGCDLSRGMLDEARGLAAQAAVANVSFVQADATRLPTAFDGAFDLAYCALAHHHFEDPAAAAASALRILRPGGSYFQIDPGPALFNALWSPLAEWGDPGWVRFYEPREHERYLRAAGFVEVSWVDLLPGVGMAVARKARPRLRLGR